MNFCLEDVFFECIHACKILLEFKKIKIQKDI